MKETKAATIADIAVFVFTVILFTGIRAVFHACDAVQDAAAGTHMMSADAAVQVTWMSCHWAERAVWLAAGAMLVQAVALLVYRGRGRHGIKAGLSLAITVQSAVCALIPGVGISLCMMETMRCHTVMRPSVTVLCILLTVSSLAGTFLHHRQCGMHHAQTQTHTSGTGGA